MNDLKILELVASNPAIKASTLANLLNVPLVDVSASLRCLVDVGDLARAPVFDDNGRQAQAYTVTDQWLKSPDGKKWAAHPGAPLPPVPTQAPTLAPTVPPAPAPDDHRSKTAIAIDYVRANGSVSSMQLHAAMGLKQGHSPASFLSGALQAGYLARERTNWTLGPNADKYHERHAQAPRSERPQEAALPRVELRDGGKTVVVREQVLAQAEQFIKPKHQTVHKVPSEGSPDQVTTDATNVGAAMIGFKRKPMRCAIWSDGNVELQDNGLYVASMTRAQAEFLADFILAERQKAAA